MKFKSRAVSICILTFFIFLFSTCSTQTAGNSEEITWKFINKASGIDYIVVTPTDATDNSSFTLKYGDSHYVTWIKSPDTKPKRGDFNYHSYSVKQYVDGAYYDDYEALEETVFYTRFKN